METGGVYPMETDLPLLDHDRIARAAEGMISNYGRDASAEAIRRAEVLRSAGSEAAATIWQSISELIQDRDGGCPNGRRSAQCRSCGGIHLDIPEWAQPDSIVLCLDCAAAERYRNFERRVLSG